MLLASGAFAGPDFALSESDLPAPAEDLAAGEGLVALDSITAAGLAFCGLLTGNFASAAADLSAAAVLALVACLAAPAPAVSLVAFFTSGATALFTVAGLVFAGLALAVLTAKALAPAFVIFAFVASAVLAAIFVDVLAALAGAGSRDFFVETGFAVTVFSLAVVFKFAFLRSVASAAVLAGAALVCAAMFGILAEDFVSFSTFTPVLADFAADLTLDEVAFADDFELGIRTLS